jgi:hypothetical protein
MIESTQDTVRTQTLAVTALLCAIQNIAAQQVATRTYAKPDIEYAEPFSQIVGLRELSDGRIIVADSRDKLLQLIDLKGGTPKKIGREGSGPGEWGGLSRLLALPGDTTVMPDPRNSRLLVIAPDGTPVRTVSPSSTSANGGAIVIGGGGLLNSRMTDTRGLLYAQDNSFSFAGAATRPDTALIVRFDLRTLTSDTIGSVKLPPAGPARRSTSAGTTISASAAIPFSPIDAWAVLPDGRLVIARSGDYHLEIVSGKGTRTIGPRVPFTPIPIGAAEKQAYLDNQKRNAAGRQLTVNGVTAAAPPPAEPSEWPATMPPFLANALFASPSGETWVLRTRPSSDPVPTLDVFNGEGRMIARVVLPRSTTILGFGARSLYLARTDDDGLQYVQRYALIGS